LFLLINLVHIAPEINNFTMQGWNQHRISFLNGVNSVMHSDCIVHFNAFTEVMQGEKGIELGLQTIWLACIWSIWKARNMKISQDKIISLFQLQRMRKNPCHCHVMELPESKIKKLRLCYLALDHIPDSLPRICQVKDDTGIFVLQNWFWMQGFSGEKITRCIVSMFRPHRVLVRRISSAARSYLKKPCLHGHRQKVWLLLMKSLSSNIRGLFVTQIEILSWLLCNSALSIDLIWCTDQKECCAGVEFMYRKSC
jgi:hypothetical protein